MIKSYGGKHKTRKSNLIRIHR